MKTYKFSLIVSQVLILVCAIGLSNVQSQSSSEQAMSAFENQKLDVSSVASQAATPCTSGMASIYPCSNVDLLASMNLTDLGGGGGNDIWGWTDPTTGIDYALMGLTNGTAFVDLSDPENPVLLGNLPTHSVTSAWRDIKVYKDHAFIVSEAPNHGMQIFDLTQLRNVVSPPMTFTNTAHYNAFSDAHNIVINEETGFAYSVGATICGAGLAMIDISNPTNPTSAGCFSSDGYTHDAQCVIYSGPDPDHQGKEICFAYNEDTVTVVDVSVKSAPSQLSRSAYPGSSYTHQGWLTEDQKFIFVDDETDGGNTRTFVWDVEDLDDPVLVHTHTAGTPAIDHNLYVKGNVMYQSNYSAGLRIYDISNPMSLTEIGYFDVYPDNNNRSFSGTWSNYPFFDSGIVVVSGRGEGLFVLKPEVGVLASIKVWLSGSYDTALDEMVGGSSSIIPSLQAYSSPEFDSSKMDYAGLEKAIINNDVIDWVLVELRTGTAASTTIETQAAILLKDGQIVGPDMNTLRFYSVVPGSYHVVVRHRNHLAVMTSNLISLSSTTSTTVDLTTIGAAYGINPQRESEPGVFAMWAGDGDLNETTSAFDFLQVWLPANGTDGYKLADYDLSGTITSFDFSQAWLPSNGKTSQVPN